MVIAELQRLADRLAAQLSMGVAIDDTRMRQFVYTWHRGNDPARQQAILERQAGPEIAQWVRQHRVADRISAFVLPANPEIGLTSARWSAVARVDGKPVAFIWAQTDETEIDAASGRLLIDAAESVAEVFEHQQRSDALHILTDRETMSNLLSDDAQLRRRAVEHITDVDVFKCDLALAAVVVLPVPVAGARIGDVERSVISAAMADAQHHLPSRRTMCLVRQEHAMLIVAVPDDLRTGTDPVQGVAEHARAAVERELSRSGRVQVWAGVGAVHDDLTEAHRSYREALTAAEVAAAMATMGSTLRYDDLGLFKRMGSFIGHDGVEIPFHSGIQSLLDREAGGDPLAATLEVFLDNAGDAARSAEQLHLHRASLYARLHRIAELTGLDMGSGHDRLVAHLELKIARLTGRRAAGPAVSAAMSRSEGA